ncbi:glycosyltransferase family 2 protein [Blautia sp. HCP3S3_G3]|uniref:glycosyltransferase family 2 protein n=1 Tax=Blautia sp. HCP3S3_G3 TaxID=3438913 RepID=UPI003F8B1E41
MTNQPVVSVVMPVYNGAQYIRQAVESVFRQDVPLELIVVDDGSSDDTEEILKEYLGRDDFHYLRNKNNTGAAASRNRGVREARGEYVAFLDADDWWTDGKLKHQLRVLKDSGAVLCSTGRELMNPDGTSTGKYIPVKQKISYRELLKHNSINCSSVLIRKEAALEFPMEHDDSHEDYLTWLKVLRKFGFGAGINEPYLKYRLSEDGKSRNKWKSALMTYKVYRYMGYNMAESILFFGSYVIHGIWKYR